MEPRDLSGRETMAEQPKKPLLRVDSYGDWINGEGSSKSVRSGAEIEKLLS